MFRVSTLGGLLVVLGALMLAGCASTGTTDSKMAVKSEPPGPPMPSRQAEPVTDEEPVGYSDEQRVQPAPPKSEKRIRLPERQASEPRELFRYDRIEAPW